MGEDSTHTGHAEALAGCSTSLPALEGLRFDVTLTTRSGKKAVFHRWLSINELRRTLPGTIEAAANCEHNVIVRPFAPGMLSSS